MNNIILSIMAVIAFFLQPSTNVGYSVGDEVKDFELMNVDNKYYALSQMVDKGAIIIFDCNTCPFSQAYRERIMSLHEKYVGKGFPVIAINSNDSKKSPKDSFQEMINYSKKHDYKHHYLYDIDQSVAKQFGATNTPQVFIVKKENQNFKLAYVGAIDNNTKDAENATKKYVEEAIDALLKNQLPKTTKTKAIGCTIKWAEK